MSFSLLDSPYLSKQMLMQERMVLMATRPTSHVKLTGITGDGPLPLWMHLYSRYTVGECERIRDKKRKPGKVVWRSS